MGSSPLARGLHREIVVRPAEMRIIPARAGFTTGLRRFLLMTLDHPRSRGVYFARRLAEIDVTGSSPLARGLPLDDDVQPIFRGIIPARAGFTMRSFSACPPSSDHPRSRGVYPVTAPYCTAAGGSSPLARGLPGSCERKRSFARIIPARAGFTIWPSPCASCVLDHPRSRGVYVAGSAINDVPVGSSPLARGLPR